MKTKVFLDPFVVAQLSNLHLRARRVLDGLYSGRHINRNRGSSREFSEHRPYIPGDDVKGLDWKIFGRTDRLVVRQYEEETNVSGVIIMDDSASMKFSSPGRVSKIEYAKTMAAALGYLLVSQNDSVGLLSSDEALPPGSRRGYLDTFFERLELIQPKGIWDFHRLTEKVNSPMKKKGFIIVFSDLMAETETVISTLRALHARKNEVLVFQILDPSELDLRFEGPMIFEDYETGEVLETDPAIIRRSYGEIVRKWISSLGQAFQSTGIDYRLLTTDMSFENGLGSYLSWRGMSL
ncbi:MAG: DUF58 domain-containing protein [Elusimicrobia bacterium]|nr:DUF58 domain-containing protein [Candidatus Obscuribacterium magneticum]